MSEIVVLLSLLVYGSEATCLAFEVPSNRNLGSGDSYLAHFKQNPGIVLNLQVLQMQGILQIE
jgi:hypothetical protein